ncbi:MAG TPA: hypothetical protein VKY80_11805 [Croceibacterium sp.]|nr:hypothetical protein [Croceibacterium sp.]
MRPQSIVMFERLFLASIVLNVIVFAIGYGEFSQQITNDPALQRVGLGGGFVIALALAGYAIYLLLWYLIARKAANWAKWVLVLFLLLSLLSVPDALRGPWNFSTIAALAVYVLQIAAVGHLFQADAKAWLSNKGAEGPNPETFD